MDPDSGADTQKAVSLQWKSFKLVQDPATRRVAQKIYRYDGVHFSVPDSGFPPVGELRDPRPRRLWSRYTEMVLPVPKFKLDEFYVGPIPLKEVTFARLNDNVKEPFLAEMCAKFGEVEEMEILFHPKTRKHLGLARVLFTSTRGAKDTVKQLHNTSVMGNIIHAQLDIKGQQRQKYYDLIVNGSYTPQTVPLGGKALVDCLTPQTPTQQQPDVSADIRRRLSSELAMLAAGVQQALKSGNVTPGSADTSFGEPRLDTPPSSSSLTGAYTSGSSASSQSGTPYSSRSGTPFSQESSYSGARHSGYNAGTLGSGYPPQDMLPSSSSSSAVSSTVGGGFKVSRYSEDIHELSSYHRGRPGYPPASSFRPNEPPCYPQYPNAGGPSPHMVHHSGMPPPPLGSQYEQSLMPERDRDSGGRYGAMVGASRRASYHHQQDGNSSSKYHSHHSHHHSDRRDERSYRRDSVGSRSGDHGHQRHRNHHHHHSHNHHSSRRRSSHDRDRDRDRERDADHSGNSDPRYNSNSYRSSSNSMSPPPSSYSAYSASKDPAPPAPQGLDASARLGGMSLSERGPAPSASAPPPPPPPPPPPLPPASVIAAAVAETLEAPDFNQSSPTQVEQWTKPKRRPSTPPVPPKTPPPLSPSHSSIASSSTSPSSTSLSLNLPGANSSPPRRQPGSASPEPDSTNESLPFAYHSSSLDSRIEMLLKEQKAKFSFLASDEEDEEEKQKGVRSEGVTKRGRAAVGVSVGEHRATNLASNGGDKERSKVERDRDSLRKREKRTDGRKTPPEPPATMPSSSTYSPHVPPPHEPLPPVGPAGTDAVPEKSTQDGSTDRQSRTGAHTPPYNGQSQSPHSSGEDMEISEEEEGEVSITTVTTHQPSITSCSSPSSSQTAMPSQTAAEPSSSPPPISESAQHFGTSIHPPIPSYPPHLPPPPPPGYSLQPPPPPGIPPPPHMELHPEYPPPMPHHMYDYASSMELMNQYTGGAPMSFQMQTHMLSRLHQLRMSSSSGTPGEAATGDYSAYHLHSLPPPPHHPYMEQEGSGAATHYEQDPRYMPPHMPPYPYTDPHSTQIPPPSHLPPPHAAWPPHILAAHYPSYMPPPAYGTMPPGEGGEYQTPAEDVPVVPENPHEVTVQMALTTLIQEMKSIMQRDLNRKMVENIAFATFDEWWDRKETKAKPFQTMSALRDEDKKEEKLNRPREPLTSLVDWAKSGGVEGFSLRGALRLPSFKVKRKEPQELTEGDMKRPRPSTPPDEDDEAPDDRMPDAGRAGRDNKRRKKKPRSRKPWELDSEGEETSDGSSSEKDDGELDASDKSDDDALSADSDDESLSSSSEGSSSSLSSSSSSSEDEEEEGERPDSDGPDTMDESTMDSTVEKNEQEKIFTKEELKTGDAKESKSGSPTKRPPSPPYPRPPSPVVLVPPLKKRRKTVSFSTEENDSKDLPSLQPSLSSPPLQALSDAPPLSPVRPIDNRAAAGPRPTHGIQLLPFASKPGEGNALIVPPCGRSPDSEEPKRTPTQTIPTKAPGKRGSGKDSPKSSTPTVMVCRTVQNLPLDHASMCRMAFEEASPASTLGKRPRGKSRSAIIPTSLREEDEDEETEQRLRLREQLGASSLLQLASASAADLSVLADVALKMDPEAGDSEETETSDEAEEQKMEGGLFSEEALLRVMSLESMLVFMEHNYCRPPVLAAQPAPKKSFSKQESSVLHPTDLNTISGVLEAPEEVIGEALPLRGDTGDYLGLLSQESNQASATLLPTKKSLVGKALELEKSKKRNSKDKENMEIISTKPQKEKPAMKHKKRKLEDSDADEDVDVEELESGELTSTDSEGESTVAMEDVRKSERLFLQEAGVTYTKPAPIPEPPPIKYENRSKFEQMTILYDIWNSGLDGEDLMLLKTTYEKLLQDDHNSDWLNDTHWVQHTVTNLPNPRRKKRNTDGQLREHVTGCARSEGYYAISRKEKDVYLDLDLPEQVIREVENVDSSGTNRLLSERRSEQRRLLTVIGTPAVMDSDLLKLNQLKFRKKKLRFGRSRIHEWGLFAMEAIAADEMVIEYVGQNIRQMVADNREKRYAQQGIGSSYLFRVDHDTIIDATKCGNLARFINHCCTPNCYAKVITIESQKKIVIYSKQAIAINEEITYDYKFPLEENKIPCLCGTENCRGTLN
ncbi:histone-lysine N-methyltransferase SETD1A [Corythoichthys intestinalis]|uniref:histone-lysine N-methyltransferase SETD1A n=1 Tax=Corythoichthys intestinalis TaxID=161448 RepID=UPI0025A4DC3C|nr:histone-lysine N-methyltransferase SETD1A [Corythoichthys intestinalis]XP_057673446.1 histone-lysine N-methyltransferase SETD1A [Corythoichthys intestinalis]XP_057673447.1 histone-lysine N-methyltransferase SETD1A [Corythoichthys intestinalis]XP_057673449.1 histone-lysine N-methyltransferase SETD1A [Corythoichthys intestinalis]XP_057673450.1 histone-lysine N-methyltransferase SETD1A [Corythoichthys intestinalis]